MSRIHVYARIRQNHKGENGEKIKFPSGATSQATSPIATPTSKENSFDHVFDSSRKLEEVYSKSASKLTNAFLQGYNTALIIFGETDSGQVAALQGGEVGNILKTSRKSPGLVSLLVNDVFNRIQQESNEKITIKLTIVEIEGDEITDLMSFATENRDENQASPGFIEDEMEGTILKNVVQLEVVGAKDCLTMAETSLSKTSFWQDGEKERMDDHSTIIIQFQMTKMQQTPITSWFRVFKLPGVEKLMFTAKNDAAVPQSSLLDVHSFGNVVLHLSEMDTQYQVPNYRESVLTTLMSDALGGNCYTHCLVTFKPIKTAAAPMVMRYGLRLKSIVNYPTQNTFSFKNILRRYRWMMKRIQKGLHEEKQKNKIYVDKLKQNIATMENEAQQAEEEKADLKAQKIALESQIADLNKKFAGMTSSRTSLSSRMVSFEEEKLKLSKEIVDLKIINNTIQQEAQKEIFQLKQKNLDLKEKLSDLERNFAVEKKGHRDQKEQSSYMKQEFQDISQEYINLKENYSFLSEEHQNLMDENQKLMDEIAVLADSKDQILKHKDHLEMQQLQAFTERLKAITKMAEITKERRSSQRSTLPLRNLELEKQLLYNVQEREEKLDSIRKEHAIELKIIEDKMMSLKENLKESEELAEKYKMKMAEQNSELLIANEQRSQLEEQCQKLDDKLKETSAEYRLRLERYITDIQEFVLHQNGKSPDQGTKENLQQIQHMVDGMKQAYNTADELLEGKIKKLKAYSQDLLQRYEQLLTAYKMVMWKTGISGNIDDIDRYFGIILPPIEDIEIEQIKERNDLKTKLYLSEQSVKDLEEKVDKLKDKLKSVTSKNNRETESGEDGNFQFLRQDMRNFTLNVQVDLEKERAELLTRCAIAEQQVTEYEEYMQTYIQRYQQEIIRLRRMLSESGRLHSADAVLGLDRPPARALPPLQDDRVYGVRHRDPRY